MINNIPKLGIIAGKGLLPSEMARLFTQQRGEVYIAALEGEADISTITNYPHKEFPIGAVGKTLEYFAANNVIEIIIIGGISRPDLKSIKVDVTGSLLLAQILKQKLLGDNNVLKIISNFIESKGFEIISPKKLMKAVPYEKYYITKTLPVGRDIFDIAMGKQILFSLDIYDVGQSIILSEGYTLGIEAAEGTDNLIRRCASLRKMSKGGVLVKTAKPSQDMRLDLPTIGPDTAFYLAKHGYNGLAIAKNEVIIVKPQETIELLNKSRLFLYYL